MHHTARITFDVVYTAKDAEALTGERANQLAATMLAVLRGSPKIKVVQIECAGVVDIESDVD